MDVFDDEFIQFWTALNKYKVEFIMVGGVATNLNGYQRTTDDLDVWIKDTIENRENFRQAMKEYSHVDYHMLATLQIIPGWTHFNLNNGFRLDLMVEMKGLEGYSFDECYASASTAQIGSVEIPFLHINHLIANKKAVNRPKDQLDVIYLEKIKKLLEEEDGTT